MSRFRTILPVTFLLSGLLVPAAYAQQQTAQTKTYEISLNPGWISNSWACGDYLSILQSGMFTTTYQDTLPSGSKITGVNFTMPMRRAGLYYGGGDSDPVVGVSIDNTAFGAAQVVPNYLQCPTEADLVPYAFGGQFPQGFGAYQIGGTNSIQISVADGTCPYWCGVSVGKFPQFNDLRFATLDVTYIPPPPIEFQITDASPESERRILISNARLAYSYPQFQAIGAHDAEVLTSLRARDGAGNYQPGITVYMRVIDPKDSAPYTNLASLPVGVKADVNDNRGGQATIEGQGITETAPNSHIYQATTGAYGLVVFKLKLQPPFVAGDNYQIQASGDPTFPAALPSTAKSGTLTAWKRIFVEQRRMLRNSIRLATPANIGDTSIRIIGNRYGGNTGRGRVSRGDRIVLVHSPDLTRSNAFDGTYMEEHTVADVQQAAGSNDFIVDLGTRQGQNITPETLLRYYKPDPGDPTVGDSISHLGGQTLTAADYFDAGDNLVLNSVFPEAFVEYIMLDPITVNGLSVPVPRVTTDVDQTLQNLADRWSASVSWDGTSERAAPNTQLLVIGDSDGRAAQDGPAAGQTTFGIALEAASYVFRGTIDDVARNRRANPDAWAMKTAAHELAHQWKPETTGWPGAHHCPAPTTVYDNTAIYCLLAEADPNMSETQRANGIARFHFLQAPNGVWHSEYLEIRSAADPFVP